jgi:hypothetical protein
VLLESSYIDVFDVSKEWKPRQAENELTKLKDPCEVEATL